MGATAPQLLTIPAVMERTSLGKTSIIVAIRKGELPSHKLCGRRLISEDALAAWIAQAQGGAA
jgi:excisionase family DNA binding protein